MIFICISGVPSLPLRTAEGFRTRPFRSLYMQHEQGDTNSLFYYRLGKYEKHKAHAASETKHPTMMYRDVFWRRKALR